MREIANDPSFTCPLAFSQTALINCKESNEVIPTLLVCTSNLKLVHTKLALVKSEYVQTSCGDKQECYIMYMQLPSGALVSYNMHV